MNTDKTIDVNDLQEFLPDEESSFAADADAAAAAADAEDPIQNVASSRTQGRGDDDASVHEEVLSAVSFGGVSYNGKPFDSGGTDNEERSFDEVEGIIRQIHSDDTTTLTQSTSDRDFAERTLPQDTFSFLIYTNATSPCFLLGIMVFLFQLAVYVVLATNIITLKNEKNPVNFPVNVTHPVRISEVMAIFISIISQDDVRKAIGLYRDGYDECGLTQKFRGATLRKWGLSILLRASEGLFGLSITFLLIMRSPSVLELLLNFSAIEFITKLDDLLFELASEGFLGRKMKKETKRLSRKSYYVRHEHANSKSAKWIAIAYFVVLCASFFTGFGIIWSKQSRGEYLCQLIFSQFGDEKEPRLGTLTGLFYKHDKKFGNRASYRGNDLNDTEKGPLLAYCKNQTRWTLSLTKNGTEADEWDPCDDWLAASSEQQDSESKSYDILTTTSSPWIVNTTTNREAPLTHHFLACYECKNVDSFCRNGKCIPGEGGEAKFDRCLCNDSHYGLRCDYIEPCYELKVSRQGGGFPKEEFGGHFAPAYFKLEGVEAYNRPIYASLDLDSNDTLRDGTDFILFTGERWIMSYKKKFPEMENITDTKALVSYFKSFHGNFTSYQAVFESEPVYFSKLLDSDIEASPSNIKWRPTENERDFVESKFFCSKCNNQTNRCLNGGLCLSSGKCFCPAGKSGLMCEISLKSISDGKCDPKFNTKEYNFDGGDCCDNTCRSTSENICGKLELGYIDTGYFFCKRESNQWYSSGDTINGVSSASLSGHFVALSGNGTILAVADPGASIVRLFDKDGADWKQRGQSIEGPSDSYFGSVISLSSMESNTITHNPRTSPKVMLAVGAPKIGLVRIFSCSTEGCSQRGRDITGSGRFGNSLSVDGDSIAIGGAARETVSQRSATNGEVKVLTWSNDSWVERGTVNFTTSSRILSDSPDQFRLHGYYISLSGDNLAVGTLEGKISPVGTLEGKISPGSRFESVKLITQVFRWNKSTGELGQLGEGIERKFFDDATFGTPWPLKAIVIKGNILAIGYDSSANVYSWDTKAWAPREVVLTDGPEGSLGWSVDLNEDANILAVGSSVENPQPSDESIQMYEWNGTHYIALFNGVPGGPAASLSLSSDGKAIAVGLPFDSSNGGSTRVYNFYQASPCDDPSEKSLRISFTTDGRPEDTTWELRVDSEVRRSSGSLSGHAFTTFVEELCVSVDSCVKFLVCGTQGQGDGLESPGVFSLMLDGIELVWDSDFGSYDVTENCPPVTQPPNPKPTVTQCPTSSPSKQCEDGSDLVRIEVSLGEQPSDSYWDLRDRGSGKIIIADVRYDEEKPTIVREVCKPREDCYIFRLSTTDASASVLVYLNGNEIKPILPEWELEIGGC